MGWFANIFSARESSSETLKEDSDGNYIYEESGTYGQSEYTVRKRNDGKSDVYIVSDSEKGHSHQVIDEDGNLIETYHDYIINQEQIAELKELKEYLLNSEEYILIRRLK